ncbi:DUF4247 domain-containing protein [Mycobacterium sp. PS03-16]|uniref:DUF4247 domain-containing protein n=1 Tax=Mycobacterium sp. PS03-16 TaxID=2559611 RepID=UPI001072ED27|nr:DUF4247 domain-containing protein [Mycobacterium sp. PS03-16]TFV60446.1 DUF4247 domain-containing protein [Mycobacterium sp. PS03-16]
MSRGGLFTLSGILAVAGVIFLFLGVSLMGGNIRTYVAENYQEYASDGDGINYVCTGSPATVADDLAEHVPPEARTTDQGRTYLRYDDDIVIVGPDGARPCTIRVEDLGARYSRGGFIFLGPGFFPGSPSGGAGGSSGGPDGAK